MDRHQIQSQIYTAKVKICELERAQEHLSNLIAAEQKQVDALEAQLMPTEARAAKIDLPADLASTRKALIGQGFQLGWSSKVDVLNDLGVITQLECYLHELGQQAMLKISRRGDELVGVKLFLSTDMFGK